MSAYLEQKDVTSICPRWVFNIVTPADAYFTSGECRFADYGDGDRDGQYSGSSTYRGVFDPVIIDAVSCRICWNIACVSRA